MDHPAQCEIAYFALVRKPDPFFFSYLKQNKDKVLAADLGAAKSELHILAAYEQAMVSYRQSRRYHDLGSVFMMLLSGEDQIGKAMESCSIRENSDKIFLLLLQPANVEKDLESYLRRISRSIPAQTASNEEFWRISSVAASI